MTLPTRLALLAAVALPQPAWSQVLPNAGSVLKENARPTDPRRPDADFDLAAPVQDEATPNTTARVTLRGVQFSGSTLVNSAALAQAIGDVAGRQFDLAGLRALAKRATDYYRGHGYPFARAVLPPQDLGSGILHIRMIEGRYGVILPEGKRGAAPFLTTLKSGAPIESDRLERTMLILNDQPGMKASPTVRPSATPGAGDLVVNVRRVDRLATEIALDNGGSRYVGRYRAQLTVRALSPLLFGDLLTVHAMHSDHGMWLASADYELPLGGSGLRGQVGVARTSYELGKEFADLDASGRADVISAHLSYPVIRSRAGNLSVVAGASHSALRDRYGAIGAVNTKSSMVFPASLQFDYRDSVLGSGITYGAIGMRAGHLKLDSAAAAVDALTARTAGNFVKLEGDVARIQQISWPLSLFVRGAAQFTDRNLDSSEKFVLGGPYGVRAYPVAEGLGDQGWLVQSELRLQAGRLAPYLLLDWGRARLNHRAWDAGAPGHRTIAGAGAGVRASWGKWSLDAAIATRLHGGASIAEPQANAVRAWASVSHRF